jgi:hypothetical protein
MNNGPIFIWERYNQKLTINPELQYLIYYRGCFCPPHVGHFNEAIKYLKYPNVKMIIHQMGNERHRVPVHINRKIWNIYIKELLPENRIDLVQYDEDTLGYPDDHKLFCKSDVLVIIRGDETKDSYKQEKRTCSKWYNTIWRCNKRGIDIIFTYDLRDHEALSASTFINHLLRFKKINNEFDQTCRYKDDSCKIEDLYQYLPELLSVDAKQNIINMLIKYDLS